MRVWILLICGVFLATADEFTTVEEQRCEPIRNYEIIRQKWGALRFQSVIDPKVAELKTILETNNQTVIVAHKNIPNQKLEREQRSCVVQYMLYSSWLANNYPESAFVEVKCPSPACEHLKATSFVSFHFYANGVLLGKLDQGLDLQEYLTKPREFFGSYD